MTLLELIDDMRVQAYTCGRRGDRIQTMASQLSDQRVEIVRRLEAVEAFKGTEASKIKAILNGEDHGA